MRSSASALSDLDMKFLFNVFDETNDIKEGNSFCFYENKECQCYPCHNDDELNCLFCYCPLYHMENCGGNYTFINNVKDCTNCILPHKRENYLYIIQKLTEDNSKKVE